MKMLMISLDKKIIEHNSQVAKRMEAYSNLGYALFIVIPDREKRKPGIRLGTKQKVYVESTGGNKLQQIFRVFFRSREILLSENINQITTQDPFFTGFIGILLRFIFKYKRDIKLEVQLHGDFFSTNYYKKSGVKNKIQNLIGRFVLKRVDKIRVVSYRIRESLSILKIPKSTKIVVKPVEIDYELIKKYPRDKNYIIKRFPGNYNKTFFWSGRMEPVKNLEWLIEIFKDVIEKKKNILLILAGEGSEKYKLQEKVKDLNLEDHIRFDSWSEFPFNLYKSADCLLFPSLSEGFGRVPMEAVAAGAKVIMNDVGVANYELKPSEKVIILPINDREAWIKAILSI